jgi:hypothetical protein
MAIENPDVPGDLGVVDRHAGPGGRRAVSPTLEILLSHR